MRQQVRRGVFETNSSSTHAVAVVKRNDYERWMKGELVARETGKTESPDPCGNFWSYLYKIEFAPTEQRDELNIKLLKEKYRNILDPENGWEPFMSPDKLIEEYKRGIYKGDMFLYLTFEEFMKYGFEGESYNEHFSHDVSDDLKVFGTYYHT